MIRDSPGFATPLDFSRLHRRSTRKVQPHYQFEGANYLPARSFYRMVRGRLARHFACFRLRRCTVAVMLEALEDKRIMGTLSRRDFTRLFGTTFAASLASASLPFQAAVTYAQ